MRLLVLGKSRISQIYLVWPHLWSQQVLNFYRKEKLFQWNLIFIVSVKNQFVHPDFLSVEITEPIALNFDNFFFF